MRSLPCAAENCGNASHMFLSAVARRVRRAVLELSFDVMSVRMISSQEISAGTIHRKLGQASRPEACGACSSVCASRATRAYSVQPLAVGLILLGRNSYFVRTHRTLLAAVSAVRLGLLALRVGTRVAPACKALDGPSSRRTTMPSTHVARVAWGVRDANSRSRAARTTAITTAITTTARTAAITTAGSIPAGVRQSLLTAWLGI